MHRSQSHLRGVSRFLISFLIVDAIGGLHVPIDPRSSEQSYFRYWAKTDRDDDAAVPAHHLLPYHSLDVAACAQVLLAQESGLRGRLARLLRMSEEQAVNFSTFVIALHDMGKFAEGFQNLHETLFEHLRGRESRVDNQVRHDSLGFLLWDKHLRRIAFEENWFGHQDSDSDFDGDDFRDGLSPLLAAVTGHHGQPPQVDGQTKNRSYFDADALDAATTFARACAGLFLEGAIWPDSVWFQDENYLDEFTPAASWLLAGVTVLADWLGSNTEFFGYRHTAMPLEAYWQEVALPRARRAVAASGVMSAKVAAWTSFEALFPDKTPRPMQAYACEVEVSAAPQLFVLEDATGSGKTEAALILAHRLMNAGAADGFYIGLPTMATANAMYARMATAYAQLYSDPTQASLVLAHGARGLHEAFQKSIELGDDVARNRQSYDASNSDPTATAQCTRWLADNRKKALLASIGVGTIDQALMAILPSKHQSLRLLGLARKVLIVDEVHAYDPYMNWLLRTLLAFHAAQGGSAILLSATLPHTMRQSLCDAFYRGCGRAGIPLQNKHFPLATQAMYTLDSTKLNEVDIVAAEGAAREVAVEFETSQDACIRRLIEIAESGQCACWVRNTVGDAVEAHQLLAASIGPENLLIFHARFAMVDRQRIEDEVLEQFGKDSKPEGRAGKILIATQVVEQSLDIDFDFMISDLAPIELLIQRAGRLRRHAWRERPSRGKPIFQVYGPRYEPDAEVGADWYSSVFANAAYVYPHVAQLWLGAKILAERGAIRIPGEARELVEAVYAEEALDAVPKVLIDASREAEAKDNVDKSMARYNELKLAEGYDAKSSPDWFEDARTPTRLGDPSTTLRLARVVDGQIKPWATGGRHRWQRSEASIRTFHVAREDLQPGDLAPAIKAAQDTMHDAGQWSVLVPLREGESHQWHGHATNLAGKRVSILYSEAFGLQIIKDSAENPS